MSGKIEVFRKIIHILFGSIIIIGMLLIQKSIILRLLFLIFLILAFFSILDIKIKIKAIKRISREQDKKFPLKGPIFFIIGIMLVILIFQQNIALASIVIVTFGDSTSTLASFFGKKYSMKPFSKFKSLFGTFCGFVVSFIFAILFVSPLIALIGSFFGMLSEAVSIKLGETDADDNLVVPLAAATAMYLFRFL